MENIESVKKLAFDLAQMYEMKYGCCAQCVLAAATAPTCRPG